MYKYKIIFLPADCNLFFGMISPVVQNPSSFELNSYVGDLSYYTRDCTISKGVFIECLTDS